mgnify:CR=1 FL=1
MKPHTTMFSTENPLKACLLNVKCISSFEESARVALLVGNTCEACKCFAFIQHAIDSYVIEELGFSNLLAVAHHVLPECFTCGSAPDSVACSDECCGHSIHLSLNTNARFCILGTRPKSRQLDEGAFQRFRICSFPVWLRGLYLSSCLSVGVSSISRLLISVLRARSQNVYRLQSLCFQWREVSAAQRLSRPSLDIDAWRMDRPHQGRPPIDSRISRCLALRCIAIRLRC